MRRREFLALAGGVAATWPLVARAQQDERVRRIGVLFGISGNDSEVRSRIEAFQEGLKALGWNVGTNITIQYRAASGDSERLKFEAEALTQSKPELIFASATTALSAVQKATRDIPIVFAQVTDPVGAGFVNSLARPGGNITGFTQHEFGIGAKWLELLKELAPRVERVAVIYDSGNPAATGYLNSIAASRQTFGVQLSHFAVRDGAEIDRAVESYASAPNGGLIVLPGPVPSVNRERIFAITGRHHMPAVYGFRYWVLAGGLASYGVDNIDLHRRAAAYVDRVLKGEHPRELPVQHAVKFQLILNLRTAKALGLTVPQALLARADGRGDRMRRREGLERSRKANWKHGWYSAEAISDPRKAVAAVRLLRRLVAEA